MPAAFAQSITGLTLTPNPVCTGGSLTVSFVRDAMPTASTETIELSDITGNFPGTTLGTYTLGGATGTLTATLTGVAAGGAYVVRVKSDHPGPVASVTAALSVTASVGTPAFAVGAPVTLCQGFGTSAFAATATNSTSITYGVTATPAAAGISISSAGVLTVPGSYTGSIDITATAAGCNGPTTATHTVAVTPAVAVPTFSASPLRCQGAGTVVYTATAANSTAITYTMTATPTDPGLVFNTSTGSLDYPANYSGSIQITASAAGCGGPQTGSITVTVTPTVGTPAFATVSSTRCQGNGNVSYAATATNSTAINYSISQNPATPNLSISGSGQINYPNAFNGTVTITASAVGCNGPVTNTHVATSTAGATTPVFALGPNSTRCQGNTTVTYTATSSNNTSPITYSITPLAAATSFNAATGAVVWSASFSGNATITATATGCAGTVTANHAVSVTPSLLGVTFDAGTSSTICVGSSPILFTVSALNALGLGFDIVTSPAGGATVGGLTGLVSFNPTFVGTVTLSVAGFGCNDTLGATHVITVRGNVTTPTFTAGATSARCQAAAVVPYPVNVVNQTSLGFTMSVAPAAGSSGTPTINASTGDVTYPAGFFGTVTVTATVTGCTGPKNASHTATTVGTLGALNFTAGPSSARCQGAQTVAYPASASRSTGIGYSLQLSTPNAGTTIDTATGTVTYSATFAGTATITATARGCGGPITTTHTVTVTGRPVFTAGLPNSRCQGFGNVTYGATSINGTSLAYSITPVDTNLVINTSNGQVSYGPSITGAVVITATAAGPGCPSITNTFNVTVVPVVTGAAFNDGPASTRCQGAGSVTYTATGNSQSGVSYVLNPQAIVAGVSINSGNGTVTYPSTFSGIAVITATVSGCGGSTSTATHTVTVTPTVGNVIFSVGGFSARCQGAGTVAYPASATTNTGLSYAITNSPGTGVSINSGTGDVTYTASFAGIVVITATAQGCNGPKTATHTVTVTPTVSAPIFAMGASSSRCQNAGTVQYTTTTVTPNTGITYTIATSPNDPNTTINTTDGTVTYSSTFAGTATITATATGCNTPAASNHVVTVVGNPVFTAGASSVRCQGAQTVPYPATAVNSTGITYQLTTNPVDALTTINPATGAVTYSAGFAGTATIKAIGCNVSANIIHVAIVNATPHIYTLSDSICSGTAPSAPLLSTVAGSSFTWTLITPLPARLSSVGPNSGSGATIINPVITNSSTLIDDSARYNVTTTYNANGQTCSGTDVFTLKVRHRPIITTASGFAICSGLNTNIQLRASDSNSTFNWTTPQNRAVTVNGNINNGTTCNLCNTISQVLRDTGVNTGIVVYTANATVNGCTGANKNITVTVNPNPIITFPRPNSNFSVCSESLLNIPLLDTPGIGTTSFYWSRLAQSGVSVFDAPFGTTIRDSVVNLSNSPNPVTYTVFDTSFLGCAATPVQFTINVNPKPVLIFSPRSICSGDSANVPLAASTGAGSTFTWTIISATNTITGAGAGGGVIIGQPLTNSSFTTPGIVLYNVVPISPALCVGKADTVRVTVNPLPKLTSDTARTICSDAQLTYLVQSSTGGGSTYTYSRTATTISIPNIIPDTAATSVNDPIVHILSSNYALNVNRATYLINLTSALGCKFNNQMLGVTVNPTPDSPGISIAPQPNLCRNTIGINLGARRQPAEVERFTWTSNQGISQLTDSTRFALGNFGTQGTATVNVVSRVIGFTCTSRSSSRNFNVSAGAGSSNPNVVLFQNNLVCQGSNVAKYQWGFDRRVNLDSVIIEGATYQNLFTGAGSGFDPGANYYWVMATFTDGCVRKAYFNEPSLSTPSVVKSSNTELKLYPNPATSEVTVEFGEAGARPYTIEVYDVAGRRLHSQETSGVKSRVNVSTFVPGYYTVICIENGARVGSARFIKQ